MNVECRVCGATDEPENGIIVYRPSQDKDTVCNICRADYLYENTVLTRQQSRIFAFREAGKERQYIANQMDISINTIDEHRQRAVQKIHQATMTVEEIDTGVLFIM